MELTEVLSREHENLVLANKEIDKAVVDIADAIAADDEELLDMQYNSYNKQQNTCRKIECDDRKYTVVKLPEGVMFHRTAIWLLRLGEQWSN